MNDFVTRFLDSLAPTGILDRLSAWVVDFVSAIAIMFLFWGLWRVSHKGAAVVIRRTNLDPTAANFVQTMLKNLLLVIGAVTALGRVGVNTASLLTSLGIAGLTVGFAARDALSNMISGLFIFWDRPFVIGDLVEIAGEYGRVEVITMRSTRVVTPDGRMLAVPNSTIINSTVASYTNFPHLRLDIPFTVGVAEDLNRVREIALTLCRQDRDLLTDPAPEVVVTDLNDYNVGMQLRVWLENEKQHVTARHAIREELYEALRSHKVEMPFETLALTPVEVRTLPTAASAG
jgi:small conductance mechanosensitive channel